jgi:diguanylate cyclase (GGDEF)-like protein
MSDVDQTLSGSVLVVEDSPTVAGVLRAMIESSPLGLGYHHCGRLVDALEALQAEPVACVLLDLSLPDADGLEGVVTIRKQAPEVPLVVLTGRDDEQVAVKAVREGAQDYLTKGRADSHLITRSIRHAIERKRMEVELAYRALHDPLTGLPNRALLMDRMTLAIDALHRGPESLALLFVDLDHFKPINDTFGHEAGDRVLVEVAARLRNACRRGDTVARLGGDEFTVLCEQVDERTALSVVERIHGELAAPFEVSGEQVPLSASVGIALSEGPDIDAEAALRRADEAMYRAKKQRKANRTLEPVGRSDHDPVCS